jgi:hypothetical protein
MKWKQIICAAIAGIMIGIACTSLFFIYQDPYRNHAAIGYWKSSFGNIRFYPDGTGSYMGGFKIAWTPVNDYIAKIELNENTSTFLIDFTIKESDDGIVGVAYIFGKEVVFKREND